MMITSFDITTYIEKFAEKAQELSKLRLEDAPPVEKRNKQVNEMIEEYYKLVGSMPHPRVLEWLANYILIKDLKNRNVDKVSKDEYPILSDIQIKRRQRKQLVMQDSTIDYLNTKYHKGMDSLSREAIKKPEY